MVNSSFRNLFAVWLDKAPNKRTRPLVKLLFKVVFGNQHPDRIAWSVLRNAKKLDSSSPSPDKEVRTYQDTNQELCSGSLSPDMDARNKVDHKPNGLILH